MNRPEGLDFSKMLELNRTSGMLHKQIATGIIELIMKDVLPKKTKLPSVNTLARQLAVNRLTIMRAMDELEAESWIVKKEKVGSFIHDKLPVYALKKKQTKTAQAHKLPQLKTNAITWLKQDYSLLSFNDGYPDYRFFPYKEIGRAYSTALKDKHSKKLLSYHDLAGYQPLIDALQIYLANTRYLNFEYNDLLITRGSTMGIFLASKGLLNDGDTVVMGSPSYYLAKETFYAVGKKILYVPVDKQGIQVDEIELLLQKERISMVYVTPHHNYPTTVSLPAERRVKLLQLAIEHNFFILEDDYDFDFHYDKSPTLPIASLNPHAPILYCGSFSKSLSPAIRLGFLVAHPEIIKNCCKWRKLIDRQGDTIQEAAFLNLLSNGTIDQVIRKARKVYAQRRTLAFDLFQHYLTDLYELNKPKGGLAFWAKINPKIKYQNLVENAGKQGLFLIDPEKFSSPYLNHAYTRLGFASMNEEELHKSIKILLKCLR